MRDYRLSEIRRVSLWYRNGDMLEGATPYLMLASEVGRFVEASYKLHFKPGKNPHNGNTTRQIWKITVEELELKGPFWWSTPDLQENDDPAGAHMIDSYREVPVWIDQELMTRLRAEDEREEYEAETDDLAELPQPESQK